MKKIAVLLFVFLLLAASGYFFFNPFSAPKSESKTEIVTLDTDSDDVAALNPEETDCLYYLHDPHGQIHCSVTYKEHVENIKKYLN